MNQLLFITAETGRICFRHISPGNVTEVNRSVGAVIWRVGWQIRDGCPLSPIALECNCARPGGSAKQQNIGQRRIPRLQADLAGFENQAHEQACASSESFTPSGTSITAALCDKKAQ